MIDFIEAGKCYKSHGIKGILDVEMNPIFKKHILSEKVVF
jgi:ribosomal 30S subunit maturation factor RimM